MAIGHYDCNILLFPLDLGVDKFLGFRLQLCFSILGTLDNSTNIWFALCGDQPLILVVLSAYSRQSGGELLSFWRALGDDNSFIRRLDRNSK